MGVAASAHRVTWNRDGIWDYLKQDYSPSPPRINFSKIGKILQRPGGERGRRPPGAAQGHPRDHLAKPDVS